MYPYIYQIKAFYIESLQNFILFSWEVVAFRSMEQLSSIYH